MTPDLLEVRYRPVAELVAYANNARTHPAEQVLQIGAAMVAWGWTNPVLVDEDGGIIAGHGRVVSAQAVWKRGASIPRCPDGQVPTIELRGLSAAERRALVLADNQIALNAGWDVGLLKIELGALAEDGFDVGLIGFGAQQLHDLLAPPEPARDPDDHPDVPVVPVSVLGDVWQLGPHRVCCGSATDVSAWEHLLAGEWVDLCWTDPPYNVAYSASAGSIQNDDLEDGEFRSLLDGAFRSLWSVMRPGASIYVAHADAEGLNFRGAFEGAGFKLSGCLIWRKDSLVLGRSDYQWMHEPILYGWKPGARHRWFGGRKLTTIVDHGEQGPVRQRADGSWVIEVGDTVLVVAGDAHIETSLSTVIREAKPKRSAEHPTMKPVGLVERFLRASGRAGDLVADAFGGSGTTLIASERMGMRARLMELDPRFVDVIVRRWQDYAGQVARLDGDGRAFAEVAQGR